MANPALTEAERERLVQQLMQARRAMRRDAPLEGRAPARQQVETIKRALGERGPVWWDDGASDFNRKLAKNTPYSDWSLGLGNKDCHKP